MPAKDGSPDRTLRFDFVEMLFALTVSQVAVQVSVLVEKQQTLVTAPAAYSHALLALILVATSWVGWRMSKAYGNVEDVSRVFSWAFLVLLLDVGLVVLYFIIANGIEMPDNTGIIVPSARNETKWIMWVFFGYLLWDLLTKAVMSRPGGAGIGKRILDRFLPRAWGTMLCFALAVVSHLLFSSAGGQSSVVLVDFELLLIVLLFRAIKQFTGGRRLQRGS
jgi:hypothetical protein